MRLWVVLLIIAGLAGCRPPPEQTASPRPAQVDGGNPLEQAAREANLVVDPATTAPTGLFERTHSAGHDGLCFTPAGDDGRYRFGMTASFGSAIVCEGGGTARHSGNVIRLTFDSADCAIDASYDGNRVRMPGRVPDGCARLCDKRGLLSGVAVERTGWTRGEARRLTSRRDAIADRPLRALCP
jgi:hypothetical protein